MAPPNEFDEESKGKEGGKTRVKTGKKKIIIIIIVYFNRLNHSASHYPIW